MQSTPLTGFCGPSYQYTNQYAAVERSVNLYCDVNESGGDEAKFKFTLTQSPGNAPFGTLPVPSPLNIPGQGMIAYQDIVYGVSGNSSGSYLWSMSSAGAYTNLGQLTNTSLGAYVTMVGTGTGQIFIVGSVGLEAWVYTISTNTVTPLPQTSMGFLGASVATFQDGYVLAAVGGITAFTKQIQISGDPATPVGDATIWTSSNVTELLGQTDFIVNLISIREYVTVFGERRSQILYNAGASGLGGFPFQSYNSTFIETGLGAAYSLSNLDGVPAWIGQDDRGQTAAWIMNGLSNPQRISTFAVEQFWQSYQIYDAISFPFKWKGHLFWQVTFPYNNNFSTPGSTWVYDHTGSQLAGRPLWHERSYNNNGTPFRRPEMFHCYCYGKHLVLSGGLDGNPGAVYQYSDSYSDCAQVGGVQGTYPMIPVRVLPHPFSTQNRVKVERIDIAMQVGVGNGTYPNPQLNLNISRDGGNTYGPTFQRSIGASGVTNQLVYFGRLGYARGGLWTLKFSGDGSAVPYNFVNAYIQASESVS